MVDSKETSTMNKEDHAAAFSWDSHDHNRPHHSQWLQATLSDLDEKTKLMLNIIDEDGDTFAKRAEMFFKRKPELITGLEDLYKSHRTLAENYDQLRCELIQAAHLRSFSTLDSIKAHTIQKCEKQISGYLKLKALPNGTTETETTYSSDDAIEYQLHRGLDERLVLMSNDQQDSSAGSDKDMKELGELDANVNEEKLGSLEKAKIREEKLAELIDENTHQQEKLISKNREKSEAIKKLKEENKEKSETIQKQKDEIRILRGLVRANDMKTNELARSKSKRISLIGRLTGCTKSP